MCVYKKLSMEKRCNSDNLSEARVLNQATLLKYTPCIAGVEIEKEKEREREKDWGDGERVRKSVCVCVCLCVFPWVIFSQATSNQRFQCLPPTKANFVISECLEVKNWGIGKMSDSVIRLEMDGPRARARA